MKILNIPDSSAAPASPGAPAASSAELERVEALEHVAKSIFQKLQAIEERIKILEETPKKTSFPAATGGEPIENDGPPTKKLGGDRQVQPRTPDDVSHFDADTVRKGLLTKMWKYLNDQAAA